jgi:hypothetical protein
VYHFSSMSVTEFEVHDSLNHFSRWPKDPTHRMSIWPFL